MASTLDEMVQQLRSVITYSSDSNNQPPLTIITTPPQPVSAPLPPPLSPVITSLPSLPLPPPITPPTPLRRTPKTYKLPLITPDEPSTPRPSPPPPSSSSIPNLPQPLSPPRKLAPLSPTRRQGGTSLDIDDEEEDTKQLPPQSPPSLPGAVASTPPSQQQRISLRARPYKDGPEIYIKQAPTRAFLRQCLKQSTDQFEDTGGRIYFNNPRIKDLRMFQSHKCPTETLSSDEFFYWVILPSYSRLHTPPLTTPDHLNINHNMPALFDILQTKHEEGEESYTPMKWRVTRVSTKTISSHQKFARGTGWVCLKLIY